MNTHTLDTYVCNISTKRQKKSLPAAYTVPTSETWFPDRDGPQCYERPHQEPDDGENDDEDGPLWTAQQDHWGTSLLPAVVWL